MRPPIAFLIISLFAGSFFARANEEPPAPAHDPHQTTAQDPLPAVAHESPDPEPHPALSTNASWAGGLVTLIITLFVLAAAVGSLARLSLPEEPPQADDAHGHDAHDAHGHGAHAPAHGGHH